MKKLLKRNIRFLLVVLSAIILSQSIFAYELGDVNTDGKITASDAAMTMQYVLNPDSINLTENQKILMNVNKEDVASALNSAEILQKALNNDYTFKGNEFNMLNEKDLYSSIYNYGTGDYYCFFSAGEIEQGVYTQNVKLNEYMTLMANEENPALVYDMEIPFMESEYKESYENKICLPSIATKEYGTIKLVIDRPTFIGIHYFPTFYYDLEASPECSCQLYKDTSWEYVDFNNYHSELCLNCISYGGEIKHYAPGGTRLNAKHTYTKIEEPGTYYIVDEYSMCNYLKKGKIEKERKNGGAISYITLEEITN